LGAILVGAGTIIADDPKLTVRAELAGREVALTKIVIDGRGRVPADARFLSTPGRSVIVTSSAADPIWTRGMEDIARDRDLTLVRIKGGPEMKVGEVWTRLSEEGIGSLLVEGGSRVIFEVIGSGAFDVLTVFLSPVFVGGQGPTIASGRGYAEPFPLRLGGIQMPPGGGILLDYRPSS